MIPNKYIINNKPGVMIKADLIRETDKAALYDCEGDEVWFPKSMHRAYPEEGSILVDDYFYKKLESEGKL